MIISLKINAKFLPKLLLHDLWTEELLFEGFLYSNIKQAQLEVADEYNGKIKVGKFTSCRLQHSQDKSLTTRQSLKVKITTGSYNHDEKQGETKVPTINEKY